MYSSALRRFALLLMLAAVPVTETWADDPPSRERVSSRSRRARASATTANFGINTDVPYYFSGENPWTDVFLRSMVFVEDEEGERVQQWMSSTPDRWGDGPPLDVNELGHVLSVQPGMRTSTLCPANLGVPSGVYVCRWEGSGTLSLGGYEDAEVRVVKTAPQSITFQLKTAPEGLLLVDVLKGPVTDISIKPVRGDDHWDPRYLSLISKFDVVRFKDPQLIDFAAPGSPLPTPQHIAYGPVGWPVEEIARLCRDAGVRAWVNLPYWADDDYVREFARRCQAEGLANPYVEFANEIWNTVYQDQYRYAVERGRRGESEFDRALAWYAARAVEVHDLFASEFDGPFVRVIGSQCDNPWVSEHLVDELGARGDALAIGPYFGGSYFVRDDETRPSNPNIEDMLRACHAELGTLRNEYYPVHKRIADQYGMKLIGYEAGQHLFDIWGGSEIIGHMINRTQNDPRMGQLYQQFVSDWRKLTDGVLVFYKLTQQPTEQESFGFFRYTGDQPTAKWKALFPPSRR